MRKKIVSQTMNCSTMPPSLSHWPHPPTKVAWCALISQMPQQDSRHEVREGMNPNLCLYSTKMYGCRLVLQDRPKKNIVPIPKIASIFRGIRFNHKKTKMQPNATNLLDKSPNFLVESRTFQVDFCEGFPTFPKTNPLSFCFSPPSPSPTHDNDNDVPRSLHTCGCGVPPETSLESPG